MAALYPAVISHEGPALGDITQVCDSICTVFTFRPPPPARNVEFSIV